MASNLLPPRIQDLWNSVIKKKGVAPVSLRRAVEAYAARAGGGERPEDDVPEALENYVDKVARYAYKVMDEDFEAMRSAGYGNDQLFEITICAAVGAGAGRVERALAALEEAEG